MPYSRLLGALLSIALVSIASCEVFTALIELERVLHTEQSLASDIRTYIEKEEERLSLLRQVADDYEAHSSEHIPHAGQYLGNPVNAFLLVKRFTSDWEKVTNLMRNNTAEEFLTTLQDKLQYFPDQEDLQGAATALMRLQDTYALQTEQLARGEIEGVQITEELSAIDCFELGRLAYNQGDYYHTILWMGQAHDIMTAGDIPDPNDPDQGTVLDYLAYSYYVQGNIVKALNLTIDWLRFEPEHSRAMQNKKYYEGMLVQQESGRRKGDDGAVPEAVKNERQLDDYRASHEFQQYEALCRGESPVERPDKHKLTCRFVRDHPIYFIRPLKEETANLDPWIVVYHDLLVDSEMDKIKELASPRLKRATVQNPATGQLETAYYRVSKSAWLKDEEDRLVDRVSAKVKAASGLSMETAEELQVVNYGIGGHYEPHYDFARKEEIGAFNVVQGNRIATGIYYMSDVEAGGATVFTEIGVQVWPEKGSMAFWYNLMQSGEGDYRTRHAACPVLAGSKWVANKWIHERGQEFIHKCDPNPLL